MGRAERKRWNGNERVRDLLKESESRDLSPDEIEEVRMSYTGGGGLHDTFGQFFTPSVVTNFIIDLLGITDGTVLEPSCGAGAFLEALPAECHVEGIEMMHEASAVSRLLYPKARITTGNTLTYLTALEERFDYVLGNPPFCDVPKYDDYSDYTIAQKGRGRAEWYFLELGLRALKPGGILAYVVPDGILGNSKDEPLRKWIMNEQAWVLAVISLPPETFKMVGTTVKTSVLVLQKKIPGVDRGDYPIFMALSKEIGWDSRGRSTGKCDLPEILATWREWHQNGPLVAEEHFVGNTVEQLPAPDMAEDIMANIGSIQQQGVADNRWGQMSFGF
jgi:type I restriction enzyme M protein